MDVLSYNGPNCLVEITLPVHGWCPVSKEPQAGSTITLMYTPGHYLLDVTALGWLRPTPEWPRDLEAATTWLVQRVAARLGVAVRVHARFVLGNGVILNVHA